MFPTIKCQRFVVIFDNSGDSKSIFILSNGKSKFEVLLRGWQMKASFSAETEKDYKLLVEPAAKF